MPRKRSVRPPKEHPVARYFRTHPEARAQWEQRAKEHLATWPARLARIKAGLRQTAAQLQPPQLPDLSMVLGQQMADGDPAQAEPEWVSLPELLTLLGIPAKQRDRARKRLERWRLTHDQDYRELQNRRRNEPRFIYRTSAVRELLADLIG